MNELARHIQEELARDRRIVLAHQPPIRLGPLTIDPAMRLIVHDDGREEIVEQRVMQVLIALLRGNGAILTRDDLVFCCWDGRIVGDDAINRVMSRLRRAAEGIGAGIFRIETITKVGYRLVTDGHIAGPANSKAAVARAPPSGESRRRVRWLLAGFAAILIAALAAFLLLRPGAEVPTTIVRVDPFEVRAGDALATDFARDLAADLTRFGSVVGRAFLVVEPGPSRDNSADYIVRASIAGGGGQIRAVVRLVRARDGEIVWSRAFERPAVEAAALREQMAVRITDVMACIKRSAERSSTSLDTESLRLVFSICGQRRDQRYAELRTVAHRLVEREPGYASGWAWLAYAEWAEAVSAPRPTEHPLFQLARRHAARAIALDSHEGYAHAVMAATTTGRQQWIERIAILERGIALDPDNPVLWMDYASALQQLGRVGDSVAAARRAAGLDPLSPYTFGTLVITLINSGQVDTAAELMAEGERRWPERMPMNRFKLAVARRDFAGALAMVETSTYLRERLGPDIQLVRLDLQARLDPSPVKRQRLLSHFRLALAAQPGTINAAGTLAFHGMTDETLRLLAVANPTDWEPGLLFHTEAAALRRDPRIMALAHRHGLVRYWLTSGKWPDFCADRSLPYDCRVEARRLLAAR